MAVSRQGAGLAAAPGLHVVCTPGAWSIAPACRREVVPVELDLLLDLVASSAGHPLRSQGPVVEELRAAGALVPAGPRPAAPPATSPDAGRLADEQWLGPVGGFLGRIDDGGVVVEDADGWLHRLDPADLQLVDRVARPVTVADLRAGARRTWRPRRGRDTGERLARLVAAGRLRRLDGEPTPDEANTADATFDLSADRFRIQTFDEDAEVEYLEHPCPQGGSPGKVPVYAVWQLETGPALSLGMLTAAARQHAGGRLGEWYEIRRPEHPGSILADLRGRSGPAVLLLSNYVWCLDHNLAVARRAKQLCPDLVVIHGGPSTPKYEGDAEQFLVDHGDIADVAVRGEGEVTLAEALDALGPTLPRLDVRALVDVPGLTYVDPGTGRVVRTEDRDRVSDLDTLPSPYLSGEFDHLAPSAWDHPGGLVALVLETNRGCPYGCTFCDWGSSTLSRVRKFSIERIGDEMEWAARRGFAGWTLADANFGILARDIDVADRMAAIKERHGVPTSLGFNVAKNTTKHLTAIIDRLIGAHVSPHFTLALQTRDDDTLEAVSRKNISTDHYTSLAASFRRGGLPLLADLMIGLPGQTVDSFSDDLQFLIDHEIPARMWITKLLSNAPMNDPAYREEHGIVADDQQVVIATTSFSVEDRRRMMLLRHAYVAFEQFGLLRHVNRHLMWDHDLPAMTVIRRVVELSEDEPDRYPLLNWVMRYFDYFNVPPLGWHAFFVEVRRFLAEQFAIGPSGALEVAVEVTAFLLPDEGRTFPAELPLAHDYVAWFRDHSAPLWSGEPAGTRPLADHGPATLIVYGDPLDQCHEGVRVNGDPRNEFMQERYWLEGHWELDSPLVVNFPTVAGTGGFVGLAEQLARVADLSEPEPVPSAAVRLSRRPDRSGSAA